MKHAIMMILGCGVPLLLIFILPTFGVSQNITYTVFFVLMLGCHLLMLSGHSHGTSKSNYSEGKGEEQ